ncbi:MAG: GAF domain-containing protein [Candidatus Sericytochromatia bacterium]|nr:GAF domain-containing protein [Candidatus Sericytochromatia bacterium]
MSQRPSIPTSHRRTPLGWIDTAIGLGLAWGLSHWLGWHWIGIDWYVPVIAVIAARFGFWHGLTAGLVAGLILYTAGGHAPATALHMLADRQGLAAGFAHVVLGALIGLIGDVHRHALSDSRSLVRELQERHDALSARHESLTIAKEATDRRIVGQAQSISALYEASKTLTVLDPDALVPAALALTVRFLGAEAVSLYLRDDDGLRLAGAVGERPHRPTLVPYTDPVLGTVLRESQVYRVQPGPGRPSGVLLAAPIVVGQATRGVLVVEAMPFVQLTVASPPLLAIIADWVGHAIANAEAYQAAVDRQSVDPRTGLAPTERLLERLEQEWATAVRYKLPLAVILIRVPAIATLDERAWAEGAAAVSAILRAATRTVDIVGHGQTTDSFLVVLPVTPTGPAGLLAGRLHAKLPAGSILAHGGNDDPLVSLGGLLQRLRTQVSLPGAVPS